METQLNRVEMRGIVGCSRLQEIADTFVARFTIATNYAYKAKDGCAVIETTWSECTFFPKQGDETARKLKKGTKVHLIGRLRNQRYTDADGVEHSNCEIVVSQLEIIGEDEPLQLEM